MKFASFKDDVLPVHSFLVPVTQRTNAPCKPNTGYLDVLTLHPSVYYTVKHYK